MPSTEQFTYTTPWMDLGVANAWTVGARIPCEDLGTLSAKGRVPFKGGWLTVKRITDTRGDYFQVSWVDRHGALKSVSSQSEAFALSLQAGHLIVKAILLKGNPGYAPGMVTA